MALERVLDAGAQKRALLCAVVLGYSSGPFASLGDRPRGEILAYLQTGKDLAELDVSSFAGLEQTTVRKYLSSDLHCRTLPFVKFPAVLGDWECHSAGCVRCLRTLLEPPDLYGVDSSA